METKVEARQRLREDVPRVVPRLSKERSMPGVVVPGSVAMAFVTASPRSVVLRYDGHSGQWQYCLGPRGRALCRRTGKVAAAAKALAVEVAWRQVTMKGLYFQQSSTNEEITFLFQERETLPVTDDNFVRLQVKACALSPINTKLLAEMKMEKDLFPVGREVAGIVLDVGSKVSFFQPDDEVVGILPLDSEAPGLCEVTQVHEHYLAPAFYGQKMISVHSMKLCIGKSQIQLEFLFMLSLVTV